MSIGKAVNGKPGCKNRWWHPIYSHHGGMQTTGNNSLGYKQKQSRCAIMWLIQDGIILVILQLCGGVSSNDRPQSAIAIATYLLWYIYTSVSMSGPAESSVNRATAAFPGSLIIAGEEKRAWFQSLAHALNLTC